jgi:transcriptional regulator with XRE-family HTH domain
MERVMSRASIGIQLKTERKKQKLTQLDAAKTLGCDRAVLSRIENGHFQGSLQMFEHYLNLLRFELAIAPISASRPTLDNMDGLYDDD